MTLIIIILAILSATNTVCLTCVHFLALCMYLYVYVLCIICVSTSEQYVLLYLGNAVTAYYDQKYKTIHHVNCLLKVPISTSGMRCTVCRKFRDNVLRSALYNFQKQTNKTDDVCAASSHANFRYLNTPEKLERLRNLSRLIHTKDQQLADCKKKLNRIIEANGIGVDETTHKDLLTIMEVNNLKQTGLDSEESFSAIFWQQQLKAAKLKNLRQMCWHPAMIRCCLYLHIPINNTGPFLCRPIGLSRVTFNKLLENAIDWLVCLVLLEQIRQHTALHFLSQT